MDNKSKLKVINWFILSPLFLRCVVSSSLCLYLMKFLLFIFISRNFCVVFVVLCKLSICLHLCIKKKLQSYVKHVCRVVSSVHSRDGNCLQLLTIFCISIRFRIYYASLKTLKWYLNEWICQVGWWNMKFFISCVCVFVCNDDRLLRILWMFLWRTVKWKCP